MINERNAKGYCCEDIRNIENYDKAIADTTQVWDCHHRGEILPCGRFTRDDLIRHGLYWHVPASQLVFIPSKEHISLHHLGNHPSEETRRRLSEAQTGEKNHLFGKHHSEETRRKMSDAQKGEKHPNFGKHHSEETKRRTSEAMKRYWEKRRAEAV